MSRHEVRAALLDYAREWAAGTADRKQGEIQALLAACRPDRSPMWRWAVFTILAKAVRMGSTNAQADHLDLLTARGEQP